MELDESFGSVKSTTSFEMAGSRQFGRTDSYGDLSLSSENFMHTAASAAVQQPRTPDGGHRPPLMRVAGTPSGAGGGLHFSPSLAPGGVVQNNAGRFANDFENVRELGEGTFGKVFAVQGKVDGIEYAVKRSKRRFEGEHDRDKMLIEIHACSKLSAASEDDEVYSIVRYYAAWIEDEHVYLQMEHCEVSLEQIMLGGSGHRFDVPETFLILRHVLLALKFLHSHNFVHLDVKPANILRKQGHYKLGDFGLARRFFESGHVTSGPGVEEGDARYLAPELLEWNIREKDLTKADLFSIGITGYELITGTQLPQNGEQWHTLRNGSFALAPAPPTGGLPGPTQELVDVTRALMHPDPAQRPSAEACFAAFLGLASAQEKEIRRLHIQNEELQRRLQQQQQGGGPAGTGAQHGPGRLKRHHSIL